VKGKHWHHAKGGKAVATDLTRIGQKARQDVKVVFTNLFHHVYDVDNLRASFDSLDADKATGVDGVTKLEYGRTLEANLQDLSGRLQRMGFRPGAKRRSYVPKPGSVKGRPLGISNLEDKIVEEAVKRVLEPIYESVFASLKRAVMAIVLGVVPTPVWIRWGERSSRSPSTMW